MAAPAPATLRLALRPRRPLADRTTAPVAGVCGRLPRVARLGRLGAIVRPHPLPLGTELERAQILGLLPPPPHPLGDVLAIRRPFLTVPRLAANRAPLLRHIHVVQPRIRAADRRLQPLRLDAVVQPVRDPAHRPIRRAPPRDIGDRVHAPEHVVLENRGGVDRVVAVVDERDAVRRGAADDGVPRHDELHAGHVAGRVAVDDAPVRLVVVQRDDLRGVVRRPLHDDVAAQHQALGDRVVAVPAAPQLARHQIARVAARALEPVVLERRLAGADVKELLAGVLDPVVPHLERAAVDVQRVVFLIVEPRVLDHVGLGGAVEAVRAAAELAVDDPQVLDLLAPLRVHARVAILEGEAHQAHVVAADLDAVVAAGPFADEHRRIGGVLGAQDDGRVGGAVAIERDRERIAARRQHDLVAGLRGLDRRRPVFGGHIQRAGQGRRQPEPHRSPQRRWPILPRAGGGVGQRLRQACGSGDGGHRLANSIVRCQAALAAVCRRARRRSSPDVRQ